MSCGPPCRLPCLLYSPCCHALRTHRTASSGDTKDALDRPLPSPWLLPCPPLAPRCCAPPSASSPATPDSSLQPSGMHPALVFLRTTHSHSLSLYLSQLLSFVHSPSLLYSRSTLRHSRLLSFFLLSQPLCCSPTESLIPSPITPSRTSLPSSPFQTLFSDQRAVCPLRTGAHDSSRLSPTHTFPITRLLASSSPFLPHSLTHTRSLSVQPLITTQRQLCSQHGRGNHHLYDITISLQR